MARARKVCSHHGCPNIEPCSEHTRPAWENSQRRLRTVSGWEQQRRAKRILVEQRGICHVCNEPGATIVDHVIPLSEDGADDESNLRPIHYLCHERKTQAESQRARQR